MNPKTTVFLDTSVQIERILGPKSRQAELEQRLAHPLYSLLPASTFSWNFSVP